MSLNMEEVKFSIEEEKLETPPPLFPREPRIGQYALFDARSTGDFWLVKTSASKKALTVRCIQSRSDNIHFESHITNNGIITSIEKGPLRRNVVR